ncbi:hypothetical protein KTD31_00010 [Burkholderia multivorans]|uniref:hypothetical protein n=1 Tax=Burkholderia multivorans TaxID=87883 RepID=UPI001C244460|nr:hypothetical protein [Burkholderia multivorans]MBU9199781.1 hypothetical protein [Burkholderia multivorans]MDN8079100.1 hypothetical protein [Burkholderia multivorans]
MKRILIATLLSITCVAAFAQSIETAGTRVGLGQPDAKSPAMLKNLRLTDPLVQAKYLNDPDMLRFLRGTYSEACTRGLIRDAADNIRFDAQGKYTQDQKLAAQQLVQSNRVWKMTSFEMEALYGAGYLNAANYCDCLMKEVSDEDLVNPKKGLDAVEKISKAAQTACEQNAKEQTQHQLEERKKLEKK